MLRPDPIMFHRLRAESLGMIPPDVRAWTLATLAQALPATAQLEIRDALLREAAELAGGSKGSRIRRLMAELQRPGPPVDEVGRLVTEAVTLAAGRRVPVSKRQLIRILGCHSTP